MDTRDVHRHLFAELTPPACEYYAGHYRGEAYRCLRYYSVCIPADSRVGFDPGTVTYYVGELAALIGAGISGLDANPHGSKAEKVLFAVALASRAFEAFLRIHPYADGNGHAARFLLIAMLGRYGLWLRNWPLDARPAPPYVEVIEKYRDGDKSAMEAYFLRMLAS
jgi:Fic family protein